MKNKKKLVFMCNGKRFTTYPELLEYCQRNNFRIVHNETMTHKKICVHVIHVNSFEP